MTTRHTRAIASLAILLFAAPALGQGRIAPNGERAVAAAIAAHPEINSCDDATRGRLLDYAARALNGGGDRPWGRKARRNDPGNPLLNGDGLTYLRPDGLFEIYDALAGGEPGDTGCGSSWEGHGPFRPGENGFWWAPGAVEGGHATTPPPVLPPAAGGGDVDTIIESIAALRAELRTAVEELRKASADIATIRHEAAEAARRTSEIKTQIETLAFPEYAGRLRIGTASVPLTLAPIRK